MHLIAALRKLVTARLGESFYSLIQTMLDEHYIPVLEAQARNFPSDENNKRLEEWKTLYNPNMWYKLLFQVLSNFKISANQKEEYESDLVLILFNKRENIYRGKNPLTTDAKKFPFWMMLFVVKNNLTDILRKQERIIHKNREIPMAEPPEQSYIPEDEIGYEELEQELRAYVKRIDENHYVLLDNWLEAAENNSSVRLLDIIKMVAVKLRVSEPTVYSYWRDLRMEILDFFKKNDYDVPKAIQKLVASESKIVNRVAYAHFKMLVGQAVFSQTS
jgi:hypothetical protein